MATLISTDLVQQKVSPAKPGGMFSVAQLNAIFPSGLIEVVTLGKNRHMIVDDNGFALGLPTNPYGTMLYLEIGGRTPIVGPILLCDDTEVGAE